MNHLGKNDTCMWDETDGFFYDVLHFDDGRHVPLKLRSMVGLIPLFAVETLEPDIVDKLPGFKRRMEWFIKHRQDLTANVASMSREARNGAYCYRSLLKISCGAFCVTCWTRNEFLSPHGVSGTVARV